MTETLSEEDFQRAIAKMREFKESLARFESREACAAYLAEATGLCREECEKAYDFYMKTDLSAFAAAGKKREEK